MLAGPSSLLNKKARELKIATHDSCEEKRLIEQGLGYMAAIKQMQITLQQDKANTASSLIGEDVVIQLCKQGMKLS